MRRVENKEQGEWSLGSGERLLCLQAGDWQRSPQTQENGPRVWAVGGRDEVSNRTAFHWHKQVSLPDTCICLVLEEAGVGTSWGRAAGSGLGGRGEG